jgi:group I intron endonuclease
MNTIDRNKPGIYRIVNRVNGKVYYGSSINLKQRESSHYSDLKYNRHGNYHIQNAYNLYGKENVIYEPMFNCPADQCLYFEQILLDMWFDNCVNCYNMEPDASSSRGRKDSKETQKKRSKSHMGKIPWNKGKKMPPEAVEKNRQAHIGNKYCLGKKLSDEHRKNIGLGQIGRETLPETRVKLSKAHNSKPKKKMNSANTSGHTGVVWAKERKKWHAQIKISGKVINLGYYKTIEDAIRARKAGELKYFK